MASKYKSPQHKLVKFFKESRDAWKARSSEYHAQLNNANNKLRYHHVNGGIKARLFGAGATHLTHRPIRSSLGFSKLINLWISHSCALLVPVQFL